MLRRLLGLVPRQPATRLAAPELAFASESSHVPSPSCASAEGRAEGMEPSSMRPWWAMPGAADLWDSILLAVPKWKQSQWKRRFKMHKQWVRPVKEVSMCPKCLRVMGTHEVPYECKDRTGCPAMGKGHWPALAKADGNSGS